MFLADLDLLAERNELPGFLTRLGPHKTSLSYLLLFCGLYLGGAPAFGRDIDVFRDAPGWHYLSYLRPSAVFNPKAFYLFWAGLFTVVAIPNIRWLKSFFELRSIQYLGKISFAFYLIHGPVLWTLGDRVYAAVGWVRISHLTQIPGWVNLLKLPAWGPVGLEFNFLCAHFVLLPTTLWLANLITKGVDEPALKLIAQGYRRLCTEEREERMELVPA